MVQWLILIYSGFKFSQLEISMCSLNYLQYSVSDFAWFPEVILSVLIPKFKFYPSQKEVVWELNNIVQPTLKGQPGVPKLPLVVEAI
jgi:hypothetical protein